mmetsp:Transcript_5223/g.8631  ORF Transcript_5223/g.8631 Transcript_5223/m.8631 type:complete len:244 (-) Transcript_5223:805-1536(-)
MHFVGMISFRLSQHNIIRRYPIWSTIQLLIVCQRVIDARNHLIQHPHMITLFIRVSSASIFIGGWLYQQSSIAIVQEILGQMSFMKIEAIIEHMSSVAFIAQPISMTIVQDMHMQRIQLILLRLMQKRLLSKRPLNIFPLRFRATCVWVREHSVHNLMRQVMMRARNREGIHLRQNGRRWIVLERSWRILHPFIHHQSPVFDMHHIRRTHAVMLPRHTVVHFQARRRRTQLPWHPFSANAIAL